MLKNPEEVQKEDKKQKQIVRIAVVKELPVQQVREARQDDGSLIRFVTIEEYLTEMANKEEE